MRVELARCASPASELCSMSTPKLKPTRVSKYVIFEKDFVSSCTGFCECIDIFGIVEHACELQDVPVYGKVRDGQTNHHNRTCCLQLYTCTYAALNTSSSRFCNQLFKIRRFDDVIACAAQLLTWGYYSQVIVHQSAACST